MPNYFLFFYSLVEGSSFGSLLEVEETSFPVWVEFTVTYIADGWTHEHKYGIGDLILEIDYPLYPSADKMESVISRQTAKTWYSIMKNHISEISASKDGS